MTTPMSSDAPPTSFQAAAILLAAGRGNRMQSVVDDKILAPLGRLPVILHSIEAFLRSGVSNQFIVVYRDDAQKRQLTAILEKHPLSTPATFTWIRGGSERQDSVLQGLEALPPGVDYVYIHDCARPLVQPGMLAALRDSVIRDKAVVLAHRVTDTIKLVPSGTLEPRLVHLETPNRARLWAMETPQVFERELVTAAYRRVQVENQKVTDDAAAVEYSGHRISLLENQYPNPKLTIPADLKYLEFLLSSQAQGP